MSSMDNYFWFITLVGLNGFLILFLALHVSRLRIVKRIAYGDGGDTDMNQAIRAHANALEHVTIFCLVVLAMSLAGSSSTLLAILVLSFTLSRCIHGYGMIGRNFTARRAGAGITYVCELAALLTLFAQLPALWPH